MARVLDIAAGGGCRTKFRGNRAEIDQGAGNAGLEVDRLKGRQRTLMVVPRQLELANARVENADVAGGLGRFNPFTGGIADSERLQIVFERARIGLDIDQGDAQPAMQKRDLAGCAAVAEGCQSFFIGPDCLGIASENMQVAGDAAEQHGAPDRTSRVQRCRFHEGFAAALGPFGWIGIPRRSDFQPERFESGTGPFGMSRIAGHDEDKTKQALHACCAEESAGHGGRAFLGSVHAFLAARSEAERDQDAVRIGQHSAGRRSFVF